jgi:sirohydrochlorin cobaltochelatase
MADALILFAHGARDPAWAAPFEAIAARVRAGRPGLPVRLAFLEFMPPTLGAAGSELATAGCRDIVVLPLFLGLGGHLRRDVPPLLAQLQATHPGCRFTLRPPAGEHDAVIAALATVAVAAVDGDAAEDDIAMDDGAAR